MAQIALVAVPVPSHVSGLVRVGIARPAEEILGHDAVRIGAAHPAIERLAIHVGRPRAAAALQVVRKARRGGVARLAKGAHDTSAQVGARPPVLGEVVRAAKSAVAGQAVVVLVGLVLLLRGRVGPRLGAEAAVVREVVRGVHVLPARVVRVELARAARALKGRAAVACGVAVVVARVRAGGEAAAAGGAFVVVEPSRHCGPANGGELQGVATT